MDAWVKILIAGGVFACMIGLVIYLYVIPTIEKITNHKIKKIKKDKKYPHIVGIMEWIKEAEQTVTREEAIEILHDLKDKNEYVFKYEDIYKACILLNYEKEKGVKDNERSRKDEAKREAVKEKTRKAIRKGTTK